MQVAWSTEESETDTDVQQSEGRKLPWILQRSSLSSSCWFYCSAAEAVIIGLDDGKHQRESLAGIFFASKSGKELRSDLREKGSEVLKDAKEIYADASTKAKEIIEEAKNQAKGLKKEADRHLSEARQRAKEILAGDEKKGGEASESAKDIPGGKAVQL